MEDLQFQNIPRAVVRLIPQIIICLPILIVTACGNGSSPTVTVEELARLAGSGADIFVLDVRTRREFLAGRLSFVDLRIPYDSIETHSGLLPQDKTTPIYCFCRSGRRSGIAARQLADMGYENVYNVGGGIFAWEEAGFDIVSGDAPAQPSDPNSAEP